MSKFSVLSLALVMTYFCACESKRTLETAELVITNAKILTIDSETPYAEAIAIKGEWILQVGSNEEIEKYIVKGTTKVVDAGGRLVTPGFNDAHVHLEGIDPNYVDLRYVTDPAVIAQRVKAQVAKTTAGDLVLGGRWEHELFANKQWPTSALLDSVSPNNPVILFRADGHSLLANSVAMKQSGITKDTPDPFGGTIVRDASGNPSGIFQEKARGLVRYKVKPKPRTAEEERKKQDEEWKAAFRYTASLGVTSVHRLNASLDTLGIDPAPYQRYRDSGDLTYRVYFSGKFPASKEQLDRYVKTAQEFPREDNWIRFGPLKGHMDGTLGSGTMMVFEPFKDKPDIGLGLAQMPYESFEERILAADKLGLQLTIHAIGPRANDWVLNAFAKAREVNGVRDSRHRIEHAQILREEDVQRFTELKIIASMQPSHVVTDKRFAEKRMGTERLRWSYAWQSLLDANAKIAFGSDYEVEPLNPLDGIYAAVTRKDRLGEEEEGWFPEQRLTVDKAIELYTLGSAYAEFMEDRKGMLKTGYLADMVMFDKDLLSIPPSEILNTKVDMTIVGGRVVYER